MSSAGATPHAKKAVAPTKMKARAKNNGNASSKKEKVPMPSLEEDETEEDVASSPTHATKKKQGGGGSGDSSSEDDKDDDDDSSSESEEEEEGSYKAGGYHRVSVGDVYNGRFTVLEKLGWGHFSTVWRCRDTETGRDVAMKVQKSASHYMEAARDEVELLECVNEAAKKAGVSPRIVKLIASFEHTGPNGVHMCMVFEMLGDNLLTLIKRYDYKGIPLPLLKVISKQMLEGMAFLHEQCKIIHTDLKPENVLLHAPLMKMAKLKPHASVLAPKELNADEKKKLKRKLKRKKQKQGKKDSATDGLADDVAALHIQDDDGDDDASVKAAAAAAAAPVVDSHLLANLQPIDASTAAAAVDESKPATNGTSSDETPQALPAITHYLVNARGMRDYPISREYATRVMVTLPEAEVVAKMGSLRRIFRFKLRLTDAMAAPIARSRSSTCFALKQYAKSSNGAAAALKHALGVACDVDDGIWYLELDGRYLGGICEFLEAVWPGLLFLNIGAASPLALPGFHFPMDARPPFQLQAAFVPGALPRAVKPVASRVDYWQLSVFTRVELAASIVPDYEVVIADLGNACWTYKHFTQDIQTRQYRSPEVILGQNYDQSTDMWSMGCFIFELATGELLFDPKSGKTYSRDEDHLAQMMELLGRMPKTFAGSGKYCSDYLNRRGELKKIHNLKFWALKDVLAEKYEFPPAEAEAFAVFLEAMLRFQPSKRIKAQEILNHPWLKAP
ncbi:Aste57867_22358 [Aphanomyces stellatus]|uniref:non-specific serine/threonine protein kinase n=1 Tax=Aphanomyces stellatus TaxID=120398 RepID=A0A485LK23_9STRA|nr:hypothetical protein As57867_022288 [Aphanomyces stellatus]VFT99021.1 Aste57867_22358 [Aphanomyces stellatus]